jgi:hypothetical protein
MIEILVFPYSQIPVLLIPTRPAPADRRGSFWGEHVFSTVREWGKASE